MNFLIVSVSFVCIKFTMKINDNNRIIFTYTAVVRCAPNVIQAYLTIEPPSYQMI